MKIIPPDGYEVDKENSTFECIKFRSVKPKTWEEFCETHLIKEDEKLIGAGCSILSKAYDSVRDSKIDRNILPSKQYAEAMLALCQLI